MQDHTPSWATMFSSLQSTLSTQPLAVMHANYSLHLYWLLSFITAKSLALDDDSLPWLDASRPICELEISIRQANSRGKALKEKISVS